MEPIVTLMAEGIASGDPMGHLGGGFRVAKADCIGGDGVADDVLDKEG